MELYGWELLYRSIEHGIKSRQDILIALVHWMLTKEKGFLSIGTGTEIFLSENAKGSELMPTDWNKDQTDYSLRYVDKNNTIYILTGLVSEGSITLQILDVKSLKTTNSSFHIENTIKSLDPPLENQMNDLSFVLTRLRNELFSGIKETISMHTQTIHPEDSPGLLEPGSFSSGLPPQGTPNLPGRTPPDQQGRLPRYADIPDPDNDMNPLRDYGRGDLDPLGRLGGGMLFNPPGMPFVPPNVGFPQGVRPPPGARFDPFSPPEPGRLPRRGPDNDHFKPPDFDYFN